MDEPKMERRSLHASVRDVSTIDADKGQYRITVFANEVVRGSGVRLQFDGIKTTNYMRNPVVAWAHDTTGRTEAQGIPIGRTLALDVGKGKIKADFEFLSEDPFVDRVRNAWDKGFIRGSSVSWMPIKSSRVSDEDAAEQGIFYIDEESDLLEWSLVAVPADHDALRSAHQRLVDQVIDLPEPRTEAEGSLDIRIRAVLKAQPTRDEIAGLITEIIEERRSLDDQGKPSALSGVLVDLQAFRETLQGG